MKFSTASIAAGSALIGLPILSHAYTLHVLAELAVSVVSANGSVTLPVEPVIWYGISCIAGVSLLAIGCMLEFRATQEAKLSTT